MVSIDTESTIGSVRPELARSASSMPSSAGLDVERVLLRLEEQHVGAALDQADGLLGVGVGAPRRR